MDNEKVYIIAEAACEHAGSINVAKNLINIAKWSGADCVKFQLFFRDEVGNKMWEKIRGYHLNPRQMNELRCYALEVEIDFLCSPFGLTSLDELSAMGCNTVKVPAPCNEWKEYLTTAREKFSKLIISSGMTEVYSTLWHPEVDEVLMCTSSYPCPYSDVNLNTLHMYDGISDHTKGDHVATSAVALGAKIVEKHFTTGLGPDKKTSLYPQQLKDMIRRIRNIEDALGSKIKTIQPSERKLLFRKKK